MHQACDLESEYLGPARFDFLLSVCLRESHLTGKRWNTIMVILFALLTPQPHREKDDL